MAVNHSELIDSP